MSKTTIINQIYIICFLTLSLQLNSQKFGDVTEIGLSQSNDSIYTDAKASYLIKNCDIHYEYSRRNGLVLVADYFTRMKINNEEGLSEFADFSHALHKSNKYKQEIEKIKAQTYNLVDGNIEITKLNKDDIYEEEINKYGNFVVFPMPNVRIGSIIDIKYKVYSPFIYSTPRHFFQTSIPVKYTKFTFTVPDEITFTPVATGLIPLTKEEKYIGFKEEKQYSFTGINIPPLADDNYVLNIDDYRSSLQYEIHSTNFRGIYHKFSESWKTIANTLLKEKYFGKVIKAKTKSANDLIEKAKKLKEPERIKLIYNYVQENVTWNKYLSLLSSQSAKKTLESSNGNAADINLLLINLLQKADINAYPVITKSRFTGIMNPSYPTRVSINYVMAAISKGNHYMFLDATSKYVPAGSLPLRAINTQGILVIKDHAKIIDIPNTNKMVSIISNKLEIDLDNVLLHGTGTLKLQEYAATNQRIKRNKESELNNQDLDGEYDFEDENDENDLDEEDQEVISQEDTRIYLTHEGLEKNKGPITSTFESKLYSPVQKIGDEIFIDAFVVNPYDENPFEKSNREFPAFFNSKHRHTSFVVLEKPEGYNLTNLPKDISIKMESNKGRFIYATTEVNDKITIRCELKLNDSFFMPEEYTSLREFFELILNKQAEKIIFQKI